MPRTLKTPTRTTGRRHRSVNTDLNEETARPFAVVSQNLEDLGCMSIDTFLLSPSDDHDEYYVTLARDIVNAPSPPPVPPEPPRPQSTTTTNSVNPAAKMQTVARLHQTCQRAFGSANALKFEFLEENGANSKQCILTITRPNGLTRSYTTQPVFSRKNEAKAHAAIIAIEMGAIDFIIKGEPESSKHKKGLVLAPLDAPDRAAIEDVPITPPAEDDPLIKQIEDCCTEWRAGRIKPQWIALNEPKLGTRSGCALRLELSAHSFRVYSCDTTFESLSEAKRACAAIALDQGVLDFIKYGNGQTEPAPPLTEAEKHASATTDTAISAFPTMTLQGFYDALPQPFPESFGDKSASEINAPAWLNQTIQSARGGRLSTSFVWITDGVLGLHGCLLRVERPGESRSYLVDARFPKRADAKAAVCLQAISQGVGSYIRAIGKAVENKISPLMRQWANEQVFPLLGSECHKVKPGSPPKYDFEKDKDAYGCVLTLELSSLPSPEEVRTYAVPIEYRTKIDAKIAVATLAVREGAIEFLRFRGQPLPPAYVPMLSMEAYESRKANKRKEMDGEAKPSESDRKRHKTDKDKESDVPLFETKKEASVPHIGAYLATETNGSLKKPRVSGSGGVGFSAAPQSSRPMSQFRPGNRSVGDSTVPRKDGPQPRRPNTSRPLSGNVPVGWGPSRSHVPPPEARPGHGGVQAVHYASYAPPPLSGVPFQANAYPPPGYPAVTSYLGAPSPAPPVYPTPSYIGSPSTPSPHLQFPQPPYGPLPPPPSQPPHDIYASAHAHFLPPQPQPYRYPPPPQAPTPHYYPPAQYAIPPAPSISSPSMFYQTPTYSRDSIGQPHIAVTPQPAQAVPGGTIYQQRLDQPSRPREGVRKNQKPTKAQQEEGPPSDGALRQNSVIRVDAASSKSLGAKNIADGEESDQMTVTIERAEKSHVTDLLDYCDRRGIPRPKFYQKTITDNEGVNTHKVWVILGKERLELPVAFPRLSEGQERVAKQVLIRLRSRAKKET